MGAIFTRANGDWEDQARRHKRLITILIAITCVTAGVAGWITVIQEHNIFFEICAAFVTFFAVLVFINVARTRIRHRNLELFHAANQHHDLLEPDAATEEDIDALPRIVYRMSGDIEQSLDSSTGEGGHGTSCSICLASFLNGEELISLPCRHLFHPGCIRPWLLRKALCPLCKACVRTPLAHGSEPVNPILVAELSPQPTPSLSRSTNQSRPSEALSRTGLP